MLQYFNKIRFDRARAGLVSITFVTLLGSCDSAAKLILDRGDDAPAGFDPIEFRAQNTPRALTRAPLDGVVKALDRGIKIFSGTPQLSNHMQGLVTQASSLFNILQQTEFSKVIEDAPAFPSKSELATAFANQDVPTLPTWLNALQTEAKPPYFVEIKGTTESISDPKTRVTLINKAVASQFKSVFRENPVDCRKNTCSTASEYLNSNSLDPSETTNTDFQINSLRLRTFYARVLAKDEAARFQLAVQCASAHLTSSSTSMDYIWPRIFVLQTGTYADATSGSTTRRVFIRNALAVDNNGVFAPLRDALKDIRDPFSVYTRVSHFTFDGAQSAQTLDFFYNNYAHVSPEAEQTRPHLAKFWAAEFNPKQGYHSFASFEEAFNKLGFVASSTRSEYGTLTPLSDDQVNSLQSYSKSDPNDLADTWLSPLPFIALDRNNAPIDLAANLNSLHPEVDFISKGTINGIHAVESLSLNGGVVFAPANAWDMEQEIFAPDASADTAQSAVETGEAGVTELCRTFFAE